MTTVECEECGQCFEPYGYSSDLCPECDREHDAQAYEEEQERTLETALSCRCGAWGISAKTGRPYHCADCVCGAG